MQQIGDLEKYLKNSLNHNIEIKALDPEDSLYGEELEMKKYKSSSDGRWVVLCANYHGKGIDTVEAYFYFAQFDTAQKGAREYTALAEVERVLAPYQISLDNDGETTSLQAFGEDETFVRKAVECINAFLK